MTAQQPKEHCDHFPVCVYVSNRAHNGFSDKELCPADEGINCGHDTCSRPHPAPAAPTDEQCRICSEATKAKAKEEGAKETLDKLKKDLKTRFVSSSNQWSKGRNSGLIECGNIIDDYLRTKEQQP